MKRDAASAPFVARPSLKLVRLGYSVVFIVLFLAVLAYTNSQDLQKLSPWILAVPALLLLWPLKRHLQCRYTHMTLAGDKLQYETGILSRSKRVIHLSKVQDVRVDQTVFQRILRTGDVSLETAGETSLLTIRNVDRPEVVTSQILSAAHPEPGDGKAPQSGT